jgi:hypothetical protein
MRAYGWILGFSLLIPIPLALLLVTVFGDVGAELNHALFHPAIDDDARHAIAQAIGLSLTRGWEAPFGLLLAELEALAFGGVLCAGLWLWRRIRRVPPERATW